MKGSSLWKEFDGEDALVALTVEGNFQEARAAKRGFQNFKLSVPEFDGSYRTYLVKSCQRTTANE